MKDLFKENQKFDNKRNNHIKDNIQKTQTLESGLDIASDLGDLDKSCFEEFSKNINDIDNNKKLKVLEEKIKKYNLLRVILNEIENILTDFTILNFQNEESIDSRNDKNEELQYLKDINTEILINRTFELIDNKDNNTSFLFYDSENHKKNTILKKDSNGNYDENHRKLIRIKLMNTIEFNLKKMIKSKHNILEKIGNEKNINENKNNIHTINQLNDQINNINEILLELTNSLNQKISGIYEENIVECNKIHSFILKKQENLDNLLNHIYNSYISKILDDETEKKIDIEILKEKAEINRIENEINYLERKHLEVSQDEEYIELVKEYKKYSNLTSL